jgi:hypothetical protein
MELAMTPPDLNMEELIITQIPQPPPISHSMGLNNRSSRSPEKKAEAKKEKKDRDKDRDKEPGRKKSRKDSGPDDGRPKSKDSVRARKGKEQQHPETVVVLDADPVKGTSGEDEVVVVGGRVAPQLRNHPSLRDAAKAMPRIPKISQRHPSSTGTGPSAPQSRDPRLMMLKASQGESANLSSFFFLSLCFPGAGNTHILTSKDEHKGLESVGGGKIGNALPSEDDIQLVAAFRNVRNNIGRPRHSHNKRPPSPGIQG